MKTGKLVSTLKMCVVTDTMLSDERRPREKIFTGAFTLGVGFVAAHKECLKNLGLKKGWTRRGPQATNGTLKQYWNGPL